MTVKILQDVKPQHWKSLKNLRLEALEAFLGGNATVDRQGARLTRDHLFALCENMLLALWPMRPWQLEALISQQGFVVLDVSVVLRRQQHEPE